MQVIQEHVEGALRELSDEREQQRLWLSTEEGGAEVSSLDECVCRLFNDSGLDAELERERVVYTPGIDGRFTLLRNAVERNHPNRHPQAVIDDPQMGEVRELARALLTLMNQQG
jgi:hypothetical protein